MRLEEKEKPREGEELDVRAELSAALAEKGITEFSDGNKITRVATEIESHSVSLEDGQTLELVKRVVDSWKEIGGLEGDELEKRLWSERGEMEGIKAVGEMEEWLAEKGFSIPEAIEGYDKLKKKASEAGKKEHLAEREKLLGEAIAYLNKNLEKLRALRGREAEELEAEATWKLDDYIALVEEAKREDMLAFLESRYGRIDKPALGESLLPDDNEVKNLYSLDKEKLADQIVALKLDGETEKKDDKMGVRNYSLELADLDSLETMAKGTKGEDRAELYRQMAEQSGELLGKVEGKEGLFGEDPVLLAVFEKRVEELRAKNKGYAQKAEGGEYEVVWSRAESKGKDGTKPEEKGREKLWAALEAEGFSRDEANREYIELDEKNAKAVRRGDIDARIATARRAVELIEEGLAALGKVEGKGFEEAGVEKAAEEFRRMLEERRKENAELLARLERESGEAELAKEGSGPGEGGA